MHTNWKQTYINIAGIDEIPLAVRVAINSSKNDSTVVIYTKTKSELVITDGSWFYLQTVMFLNLLSFRKG